MIEGYWNVFKKEFKKDCKWWGWTDYCYLDLEKRAVETFTTLNMTKLSKLSLIIQHLSLFRWALYFKWNPPSLIFIASWPPCPLYAYFVLLSVFLSSPQPLPLLHLPLQDLEFMTCTTPPSLIAFIACIWLTPAGTTSSLPSYKA